MSGTGSAAGDGVATQAAGDGLGPQGAPANLPPTGDASAPSGDATSTNGSTAPQAPMPASGANVPAGQGGNVATANPPTPPDWNQFRYAFSSDFYGQAGSASADGLYIYLTANPNFCVNDPNMGMVDGTLEQGEIFLTVTFGPPIRGTYPGAWAGAGDYGVTPFKVSSVASDPEVQGFCKAADSGAVYSGNVVVQDANDGTYRIDLQAALPVAAPSQTATGVTSSAVPVLYSLPVVACRFGWQSYQATPRTQYDAPFGFRPYGIYSARCTAPAATPQINVQRSRRR